MHTPARWQPTFARSLAVTYCVKEYCSFLTNNRALYQQYIQTFVGVSSLVGSQF